MKKYGLILLSLTAVGVSAQVPVTQTDAEGYLARGKQLYEIRNYTGCIDQLRTMSQFDAPADLVEEAEYYSAMAQYRRGDGIDALRRFVAAHPASVRRADVRFAIGNEYFMRSAFANALGEYNQVPETAFAGNESADLTYRRSFCYLRMAEFDKAKEGFDRLRSDRRYSECADFYTAYIQYCKSDYAAAENGFRKVRSGSKLYNEARFYIGQLRFHDADYASAVQIGNSLIDREMPDDMKAELYRYVGESEYHLANNDRAISLLKRYTELCQGTPQRTSLYILGVAEFREGNDVEAIARLTDVVGEPDALAQSAYLYIGQAYLHQDNVDAAAMAFEKAYKMDLDRDVTETALYNYAIAQSKGGRVPFANSVTIFEDFLNRFPNSKNAAQVEDYIINSYMADRNYDHALATIAKLRKPSDKMLRAKQNILYHLGVQQFNAGKTADAIKSLEEAAKLASYDKAVAAETQLWLAEAYYKNKRYSNAEAAYRKHLANTGRMKSNDAVSNFGLGYALYQQKKYDAARKAFASAVDGLTGSLKGDANNRIGDCYYYARNYSQAATYYDRALADGSTAADYSLFQKGFMLGLQKRHDDKIKIMDKVVADYPSSVYAPKALYEKAQAYIALGKNESAESTIHNLMKKYPKSSDSRAGQLQLAMLLNSQGRVADAKKEYRSLITSAPTSDEAKAAAEDLKVIYANEGNIAEFAKFMKSVDSSYQIDENEMDRLTFQSAENDYIADGKTAKLKAYLKSYPAGAYAAQANYYLAENAVAAGNSADALAYAERVVALAPDASIAENALAIASDALADSPTADKAKTINEQLLSRATVDANRQKAQLRLMRFYREKGNSAKALDYANRLSNAAVADEDLVEIEYTRAAALAAGGKTAEAIKAYESPAKKPQSLYGARATVELAELYIKSNKLSDAERVLKRLVDTGTPHQYWLARGFIALSDVYARRGDKFQAREYLLSLKENYPGTESDIFEMINVRLNELGSSNAK